MVLAVGLALDARMFHTWSEVAPTPAQQQEAIDLLAICPRRSLAVGVEAKRLDDGGKALSLATQ